MTNFRLRFLFLTLTLIVVSHLSLQAQRTIGVKWDTPTDPQTAISELSQFNKLGISTLEVDSQLSPEIWQRIDSLGFNVYGKLGIKFPLTSTFSQPDSSLIRSIQKKASTYLSQPSVSAIGLFEYGATHQSDFSEALTPFVSQIKKSRQVELYYMSRNSKVDSSFVDFVLHEVHLTPANLNTVSIPKHSMAGGFIFKPTEELEPYLSPFKKFVETTSVTAPKPIFVHSSWLFSILDKYPHFAETLHTLTSEEEVIFPLPKEETPSPKSTMLPILVLLLVWGSIGWHYNSSPLYRKSLFRYFFGHKFFIDDIFKRQIRSSLPAFTIILQNALLLSGSVFATFSTLFSSLGQTAFFYHFSPLTFFGETPFSIFIWAFLVSITFSLTSIVWLSISHKSISSLTQVTTIYAWPLQLNFIFCTIAITIFSAGGEGITVAILTAVAMLVFLLTFIFTSLDTIRLSRSRFAHLIKTIIPYLLILGGLMVWIFTREQWMEVISLSLTLT